VPVVVALYYFKKWVKTRFICGINSDFNTKNYGPCGALRRLIAEVGWASGQTKANCRVILRKPCTFHRKSLCWGATNRSSGQYITASLFPAILTDESIPHPPICLTYVYN